ncbi:MAG: 50S ribosomal protein L11 methyltransferase [Ruminococcaceae bacterium]|nr:50S ribosomal protein L11 methyltransferase [Oscillospiraceae bacterium]
MEWTEVTVKVKADDIDKAGDIANMAVPYGIYIEDYRTLEEETWEIANIDLIDEELLAKDKNTGYIHLYLPPEENPNEAVSFLSERYNAEGISHEIDLQKCKNEDWENNWKEYFKPIKVGRRILIRPLWIDDYDNSENREVLSIEPGLAFGTGSHDTTRLCLEMTEKYLRKGDTVLDTGCGSGILAIASLLLGAQSALGVDIDELAVKTAAENGRVNGFDEPRLKFVQGNLTDKVSGKFNLILANIVADVIIMFSDFVGDFMEDGAHFIVSGIISERENEVREALNKNGFETVEENRSGDWLCFVLKKRI